MEAVVIVVLSSGNGQPGPGIGEEVSGIWVENRCGEDKEVVSGLRRDLKLS